MDAFIGVQILCIKKGFYVDCHETEETVRYRIKFVRRYIEEYEPYMLCWIQIPLCTIRRIYKGREYMGKTLEEFVLQRGKNIQMKMVKD